MKLYENRIINGMEIITYFNVMALCVFTWYTIDTDANQVIVTNISIGITMFQLTAVTVYHAYKYNVKNGRLYAMIQGCVISDKIKAKWIQKETNDYDIPQIQPKSIIEPTQSVVEITLKPIAPTRDGRY